jgi:hypothetical protein
MMKRLWSEQLCVIEREPRDVAAEANLRDTASRSLIRYLHRTQYTCPGSTQYSSNIDITRHDFTDIYWVGDGRI